MELTVLGATGATGRELVRQALERGHTVRALVRDASSLVDSPQVTPVRVDVHDADSIARAVPAGSTVLSVLGNRGGDTTALSDGARALVATRPSRLLWLGALGVGDSARRSDLVSRMVMRMMAAELPDREGAARVVREGGGTLILAGPLVDRELSPRRTLVVLETLRRSLVPSPVGRATVAALMLDEVEHPRFVDASAVARER